jgi:hypothetical protein
MNTETETHATTVDEAKKQLRQNFDQGSSCPCCGQFVKRYRRRITAPMVVGLSNLYKLGQSYSFENWFHVTQIFKRHPGDFAKLSHWGLIEESPPLDTAARTSGMWRITDQGADFVEGKIHVPQYVYIFNQKFLGFDGDDVTVHDCLNVKFDYTELMKT